MLKDVHRCSDTRELHSGHATFIVRVEISVKVRVMVWNASTTGL